MPLPSLEKTTPVFDVTIPSTEQTVQFRPFLVKEEQVLLQAQESKDAVTILDALGQVTAQCAISPVKPDSLAWFDIEYIFLQLRAKSVGETIELSYRCQNEVELTPEEIQRRRKRSPQAGSSNESTRGKCDNSVIVTVDLNAVQVHKDPTHTRQIHLSDTLGITMRYPGLEIAKRIAKLGKDRGSVGKSIETIAWCVESIFDEKTVYSNFTNEEMVAWLENLTHPQFAKVAQFFETMPTLAQDLPFECKKCGFTSKIHLEGLEDFFL